MPEAEVGTALSAASIISSFGLVSSVSILFVRVADAHLSVVSCVCVFLCVCDVDFSAKEQQTEAINDSFESLSTLVDPNRLSEFFDQYFDHSDR